MPSQRQFNLELIVLLPLLWGFVALVLACIIPPAHLGHQLAPLLQHHPDGPDGVESAKSALILTAHPDDESMFFAPTIRALVKGGWEVRGLCLSNGNDEGRGLEREGELRDAYEVLGVEGDKVDVLDLPYVFVSAVLHRFVGGLGTTRSWAAVPGLELVAAIELRDLSR